MSICDMSIFKMTPFWQRCFVHKLHVEVYDSAFRGVGTASWHLFSFPCVFKNWCLWLFTWKWNAPYQKLMVLTFLSFLKNQHVYCKSKAKMFVNLCTIKLEEFLCMLMLPTICYLTEHVLSIQRIYKIFAPYCWPV